MPLNSIPPTTTVANLLVKQEEARRIGTHSDISFWGGIVPGNESELVPLLDAGVKGFKCFLINSGVDEFPHVTERDLVKACDALKGTNAVILFHAELEEHEHEHLSESQTDPSAYATFLASRPASLELSALDLILKLARSYRHLRFHIVHLSAASALPRIRDARTDGINNLTVETCFHYLCLQAEHIPSNATEFKCCPPIRNNANRQLLRQGVLDGTIDYVVSDHSPCIPELKKGDFMRAWGGVSGLGLGLSLLWTEFRGEVGLERITSWLSSAQAAQVGLEGRKGELRTGADADFVVFRPDERYTVTRDHLLFKNKVSPYIGRELHGQIVQTWLRGRQVWDGKRTLPLTGTFV
ncbi:hypothetical protein BCR39DRAFT_537249 [Naematelia encephala]|uniref:allantoinase n=1 Tax=Naematelia encephala TaxID=71784 RepID=A0A1Y2AZ95_9TREE|nr:hypothetical protein BCR39DRAFT_537249 [Naematelia encephala]